MSKQSYKPGRVYLDRGTPVLNPNGSVHSHTAASTAFTIHWSGDLDFRLAGIDTYAFQFGTLPSTPYLIDSCMIRFFDPLTSRFQVQSTGAPPGSCLIGVYTDPLRDGIGGVNGQHLLVYDSWIGGGEWIDTGGWLYYRDGTIRPWIIGNDSSHRGTLFIGSGGAMHPFNELPAGGFSAEYDRLAVWSAGSSLPTFNLLSSPLIFAVTGGRSGFKEDWEMPVVDISVSGRLITGLE